MNPGNLVMENLDKTYAEAKAITPKVVSFFEGHSSRKLIASTFPGPVKKEDARPASKPANIKEDNDNHNNEDADLITPAALDISTPSGEINTQLATLQATANENKDFSIKETETDVPETPIEIGYPFIPNSSYSIYNMEDSSVIKLRVDKEKAVTAINLSIAQAQKAMEKIDWSKIARQQNMSKATVEKLQKAIKKSFNDLNWSQIYNEAADSVHKTVMGHVRASVNQNGLERINNNYNEILKQYQSGQTELHQQLEKYKNGVELELQQTQKAAKKKKVTVYL